MIWLVLSILFSSILFVIFKLFERLKVHTLQAIVINYAVAACIGFFISDVPIHFETITQASWLPYTLILGFLFIAVFNVMALTTQRNGLSVAAVAGKMSLVIPVTLGIAFYKESAGWIKMSGIVIALLAVYLTTVRARNIANTKKTLSTITLPVMLFLGSGIIDSLIKFIEVHYLKPELEPIVSATIFSTAFVIGSLVLGYDYLKSGTKLDLKSVIAGIVLGIPNYFSIIFIFKALASFDEASFVYPLNHVGTIIASTFLGLLLFRERLHARNWLGILLAVAAIALIAFAKA